MHSLMFLAARIVCKDTIAQCVDLIRHGPLPRPDVLEIILMVEEAMVHTDQSVLVYTEDAYISCVRRILYDFTWLLVDRIRCTADGTFLDQSHAITRRGSVDSRCSTEPSA